METDLRLGNVSANIGSASEVEGFFRRIQADLIPDTGQIRTPTTAMYTVFASFDPRLEDEALVEMNTADTPDVMDVVIYPYQVYLLILITALSTR